jgi:hypothetical protein
MERYKNLFECLTAPGSNKNEETSMMRKDTPALYAKSA